MSLSTPRLPKVAAIVKAKITKITTYFGRGIVAGKIKEIAKPFVYGARMDFFKSYRKKKHVIKKIVYNKPPGARMLPGGFIFYFGV